MLNLIAKKSKKQIIDLKILKTHLRIASNLDDDYLNELILMSTDILERAIGLAILEKEYRYIAKGDSYSSSILLPLRNVKTIISVKDLDHKTDIPYYANRESRIATVKLFGIDHSKDIEIRYVAGMEMEKGSEVPKDLQLAILLIAKNIYDDRSEEDILANPYIKRVIDSYRGYLL